jgi:ankyrin repeat protein
MLCVECVECERSQDGGNAPLHCASFYIRLDMVQLLVEQCGADVHAKDSTQRTALDHCTTNKHAQPIATFLRQYSDPKPKMYALCMGLHRRLGVDSALNMLNVDVMHEIGKFI